MLKVVPYHGTSLPGVAFFGYLFWSWSWSAPKKARYTCLQSAVAFLLPPRWDKSFSGPLSPVSVGPSSRFSSFLSLLLSLSLAICSSYDHKTAFFFLSLVPPALRPYLLPLLRHPVPGPIFIFVHVPHSFYFFSLSALEFGTFKAIGYFMSKNVFGRQQNSRIN